MGRLFFVCATGFLTSCSSSDVPPGPGNTNNPNNPDTPVVPYADFIRGADLSFLPEIEAEGTTFNNSANEPADVITILKGHGCNTIRIRLWHTPASAHSGLEEVIALADRVKAAGLKVFLDIHYSDTWADPGHQQKPAAWSALSLVDLKDSVYRYTKMVVTKVQPDYVQIGNEINGGMLWENGRINQIGDFIALVKEGCRGAREALPSAKILIHFAGLNGCDWFFGQMKTAAVDYDRMAISYYPMFHGLDLNVLKSTINGLITLTDKPLIIAETSYPFTLLWNDNTNNILGLQDQLIPAYPATPTGQKNFLLAIKSILKQNPKGAGFCYWGTEWVAFKGPMAIDGSSAENQALFSFGTSTPPHKEVPAMEAFVP